MFFWGVPLRHMQESMQQKFFWVLRAVVCCCARVRGLKGSRQLPLVQVYCGKSGQLDLALFKALLVK